MIGLDSMISWYERAAPTDPAPLSFRTLTICPSFPPEFNVGEGGKTAVSISRWINTRGGKGAVVGDHDGDGGGLAAASHLLQAAR